MRPPRKNKLKNQVKVRDTNRKPAKARQNESGFKPKPKHASRTYTSNAQAIPRRPRKTGIRPSEELPLILETLADNDHALLDSGDGLKLEQYGPVRIIRPEQQAIWGRSQPDEEWDRAEAVFTGDTDEEGMGRWRFPKDQLGETWPMAFDGLDYLGRFTSFRHVGVFPEQAAHWREMVRSIQSIQSKTSNNSIQSKPFNNRQLRVLNLFGYTGVASLVAANAGAHVTHVDASKKAIGWARENQSFAGLDEMPIRWICEDAMKFVQREVRRGNTYDIILLDPPAYGRGPNGEVWQLFDHLPDMVDRCRDLLSDEPVMLVLTAYAIRASFYAIHEVMMDSFTDYQINGTVESGELIIREKYRGRALSTSMFSRWIPESSK